MVLSRPVQHRVHEVFAHHRALAGQVVAAAGPVGGTPVGPLAVPVAGHRALQPAVGVIGVVVHDVHDDAQPRTVQRGHHGAAFPHAHRTVERVGGVGAFGHVIVQRVIPPVVAAGGRLVDGGVVKDRLQLHMRDAQLLEVVYTGGVPAVAVQRRVVGHKAQVGAAPGFGHAAVRVGRKIGHVHLPHAARVGRDVGAAIVLPAVGRGGRQVDDHAALPVGPRRAGVGVDGFGRAAAGELQLVYIVDAVQIPRDCGGPYPLPRRLQHVAAQVRGAGLGVGAGGVQLQGDGRRRGRPQLEHRLRGRPDGPQIVGIIIRQFAGLLPVHGDPPFMDKRQCHCNSLAKCLQDAAPAGKIFVVFA